MNRNGADRSVGKKIINCYLLFKLMYPPRKHHTMMLTELWSRDVTGPFFLTTCQAAKLASKLAVLS